MPADWNVGLAGQQGQPLPGSQGPAGPSYKATSTTSLPIATGPITVQTQAGLAYQVGARTRLSSNSDPTQWMEGIVTAYSATSMSINVDFTSAMTGAAGTQPTIQVFKSGSGTYTTPVGCARIEVTLVGGGGGGGGSGTASMQPGGAAGNTTFGPATAFGATAMGAYYLGGPGGAAPTGCTYGFPGANGCGLLVGNLSTGGSAGAPGAPTPFGGGGAPQWTTATPAAAPTNTGSGGAGAPNTGANNAGASGGAGAYGVLLINGPAASYSYVVGAGGAGGAAGTSGYVGGAGAAGIIIVREYYL